MADHAHHAHFESLERQQLAARFAMWVFLASELLLFAGLFFLYTIYRAYWPEAFAHGVAHNPVLMGTSNTIVLITASITVAMGLHKLQHGEPKPAFRLVGVTILLALVFLVIKFAEYGIHIREGILPGGQGHYFAEGALRGEAVFFTLYWVTTGLHAIHVTVGAAILLVLALRIRKGRLTAAAPHSLEIGALYWHLVDAIWIFLWPLYYLTGGVPK
jgi:cytochrome c oxidase subunit 3